MCQERNFNAETLDTNLHTSEIRMTAEIQYQWRPYQCNKPRKQKRNARKEETKLSYNISELYLVREFGKVARGRNIPNILKSVIVCI